MANYDERQMMKFTRTVATPPILEHDPISAARDRVVEAALALDDIHNSTCVCAFCEAVRDLRRLTAKAKEGA